MKIKEQITLNEKLLNAITNKEEAIKKWKKC